MRSDMAADLALVWRFWALFQCRQWQDAQALLGPQAQCRWWATREQFDGAAAVLPGHAAGPEAWVIRLLELQRLPDRRNHSLVRVDQGEAVCYANSFFKLEFGLIARLDEYWSGVQPAPAWRSGGVLPGLQAIPPDCRMGMYLGRPP